MQGLKILVINGPNLNLLGIREPGIYGQMTLNDVNNYIAENVSAEVEFFQSNHEGAIIDKIHEVREKFDGCVINPGAYTHYSYAIYDAIRAVEKPFAEVHISDVDNREDFRKISVTAPACIVKISGHGIKGYVEGIKKIEEYVNIHK